ncbi:MAG: hypothetical protein IPP15_21220 [Saprospiraceae bacterium]|uniref:Uncharacterized protein n=1 Tax=Candidatus Opimibacter skivensis TaxID=2982028 RepID=A0A9D7XR73_9BACT|nr:hypothetical protein [Candidatus Opimibacter skivensis]
MDLKKAQRLITKLQTFLDNGNAQDISRLEKDLIKSYIIQLYDAVTDAEGVNHEQEKPIEFVEYKMPKREAAPKIDLPPLREYVPEKSESPEIPKPLYTDHVVTPPKEKLLRKKFIMNLTLNQHRLLRQKQFITTNQNLSKKLFSPLKFIIPFQKRMKG